MSCPEDDHGTISRSASHVRRAARTLVPAVLLLCSACLAGDAPCGKAPQPGASNNSRAVLEYSECALKQGDQRLALKVLGLLRPQDGESHFKAGVMLVQREAYTSAANQFGLARKSYKDPYLAGYNQALAYLRADNYPAAIETTNELLTQGYETAELAELAASAYLKNGQPREATNALRLATGLDPKDENAYVELCMISLDHDKYDQGLQIAEIGISHLPRSGRLYLQRGVMRAMKGQFALADQDFSLAAELSPREVLPRVAQGLIAMQSGNLEKAVETFRRAAQEHPESYVAQYWFGNALVRSGAAAGTLEGEEVLNALEASVRLNPNYWHARADLGKILLDRGKVDRAILELNKAAELNPQSTTPLYLLAQAYRRKGDEARAQELTTRVGQMQAEDREALSRNTLKGIVREGETQAPAAAAAPRQ